MNTLHIYGQTEWHCPAFIVGDMEALKNLCDTIKQVIETGKPVKFESMVNDGEGYFVHVMFSEMEKMAVPYTNDIAAEKNSNIWPEAIVKLEDEICIEEGDSITPTAKKWSPEKLDAFVELIRKS
jgi:hypothetical protein